MKNKQTLDDVDIDGFFKEIDGIKGLYDGARRMMYVLEDKEQPEKSLIIVPETSNAGEREDRFVLAVDCSVATYKLRDKRMYGGLVSEHAPTVSGVKYLLVRKPGITMLSKHLALVHESQIEIAILRD